jgi:hypothetical protein
MKNSQKPTKKSPLPINDNEDSNAEQIKKIATYLLLNGLGSDTIGATPEHIAKIAIIQAKNIMNSIKFLEQIPNDSI